MTWDPSVLQVGTPAGVPFREFRDEVGPLTEVMDRLASLPEHLRQFLADQLWAGVPTFYNEYQYLASATQVTTTPPTNELVAVGAVVASIPSGTTGLVQIHDLVIPVGQGLTTLALGGSNGLPLRRSDTRSLTLASGSSAGPMLLWLSGRITSDRSVFS